jgi:hypothetical protein
MTMKLITRSELARRSNSELAELFRSVSQQLVSTKPGSAARRNALASLETIQRERAARQRPQP